MTPSRMCCTALALILACAAGLRPAAALSWPLCDNGGSVWVTERPYTGPTFPGANLWFFCESGLNILGVSVEPCIESGGVCGPAVADTLCRALGYDRAWLDELSTTNASRTEAVRSLTGEYCLRAGVYSPDIPDDLEALEGEPCAKIDGIACIRNMATMASSLDAGLAAFQPLPPAVEPVEVVKPEGIVPPPVDVPTAADAGQSAP